MKPRRMSPEAERAFAVGVEMMRLYCLHDRVSITRRVLESYTPAYITQPIKRLTKGENDGAASRLSD